MIGRLVADKVVKKFEFEKRNLGRKTRKLRGGRKIEIRTRRGWVRLVL